MIAVAATLCAMLGIAGMLVMAAALVGAIPHRPRRAASSTGLWTAAVEKLRHARRSTILSVALGLLAGVSLMYVLGWPVLIVVVPAAAWGLPRLLSDPPQDGVRLLEALDRWVRGMLAQLSTGKSITDAVRLSARQAPEPLAEALSVLVKRLDDRWTAPQALQAMADELDSADSDAVLAALILATQRGGTGAFVTLHALADSIQDRLRALREIEAERAKPRVVVRQVTVITVLALVVFMVFAPDFFAPYGTPAGQLILLGLLACYGSSVWAMRRMTLARSRERILRPLP